MNQLIFCRILFFGTVALSFPAAAIAVFVFGFDRHATADLLSIIYSFGIALGLSTAFWPLAGTRDWTVTRRIESLVLVYLGMSYVTHLTWELGWLVAHKYIAAHADSPWTYAWWAYIDGGDARYAQAGALLMSMEFLSVLNGLAGAFALTAYLQSNRKNQTAVLVMAGTAVVHLYSAALYYLTELLDGFPNVNTASFVGTYIKFWFANSPWVVVPWFVFAWARRKLVSNPAGRLTAG